ncbi:hypothetical protein [Salinivibrio sp. KP-1]|uniref:hypothetical protein n=1 Tax=Salinivibrio sp. KP-1 TaxID=1406902 RepID=UPI000B1DC35B|nr:hypothetical protein [Salinivibrio sp. KP-1]
MSDIKTQTVVWLDCALSQDTCNTDTYKTAIAAYLYRLIAKDNEDQRTTRCDGDGS